MTTEQFMRILKKFPYLEKIVYSIAGLIVLLGLTIGAFIMNQMFDDKRQYNEESEVVNFINWFKDTTKDAVKNVITEELNEKSTTEVENKSTNTVGTTGAHPSDLR